jgi:hypothetical protein
VANFVTPTKLKKMGLGDGIGQKKPCHHLSPFKILFSIKKNLGVTLKHF